MVSSPTCPVEEVDLYRQSGDRPVAAPRLPEPKVGLHRGEPPHSIDPLLGLRHAHLREREGIISTRTAASAAWNVITNLQARGVSVEYDSQIMPPVPPHILVQPANRSAFPGDPVILQRDVWTRAALTRASAGRRTAWTWRTTRIFRRGQRHPHDQTTSPPPTRAFIASASGATGT